MKTIKVDCTSRLSIKAAIWELQDYKKEWQRKANLCCEVIASALADEIQKNLDAIPYTDDRKDVKFHAEMPAKSYMTATATGNRVTVSGVEVAFVEFGSGIYHNSDTNNPLADKVQFDTAIGSYGKGHGNEKYWFIAHNLISCGTPAYMPIQNAIDTIKPQIPTMVRQVFV